MCIALCRSTHSGGCAAAGSSTTTAFQSLPNNLHKYTLATTAIKFAVENLFPRTEIELPFGDGHNNFTAHDLSLHVRVGVVLAGTIMLVLRCGCVRREFLQPDIVIVK